MNDIHNKNLGPILFLLCINDLPNSLEMSKPSTFADDTNLTCVGQSSSEIETKLNEELGNVHRWLTANKLTLNDENRVHAHRLKITSCQCQ